MKNLFYCLASLFIFYSISSCNSCSNVDPNLANTAEEFMELINNPDAKIARSIEDFDKMIKQKTNVYSKLDKKTLDEFKKHLVFKNGGLSTAKNSMIKAKLSGRSYRNFWSIFGISGGLLTSADHDGYKCESAGSCKKQNDYICTSNC